MIAIVETIEKYGIEQTARLALEQWLKNHPGDNERAQEVYDYLLKGLIDEVLEGRAAT